MKIFHYDPQFQTVFLTRINSTVFYLGQIFFAIKNVSELNDRKYFIANFDKICIKRDETMGKARQAIDRRARTTWHFVLKPTNFLTTLYLHFLYSSATKNSWNTFNFIEIKWSLIICCAFLVDFWRNFSKKTFNLNCFTMCRFVFWIQMRFCDV